MLIEFTVGNYRSFKDPQTLSMVAAPLKAKNSLVDVNNVIHTEGQPDLLTSAAIYGANASGKSNLISALTFMQEFVQKSARETKSTGGINVQPFRLNTATVDQSSRFEVVFIQGGVRYRYGFEVTTERVVAEWLYHAPATRESYLFTRDGDTISLSRSFVEGRKLQAQTRPNALFLSVVAQFNGPTAQAILDWFYSVEVSKGDSILTDALFQANTTRRFTTARRQAEAIRRLVCRLDLGIADLRVEKVPRQNLVVPDSTPDPLAEWLNELWNKLGNEQSVLHTVHAVYDDDGQPVGEVAFKLDDDESQGTKKLFALAGPLLGALEEGGVVVIDEFDARLHPLMTHELVRLFNDRETNRHGAQLIFNTQDTNLLDNELFRRDQIWFVEKDRYGASRLYSLAEFKGVRNDLSFERGYIEGRFGAIPYLNPNKLRALLVEGDGEGA